MANAKTRVHIVRLGTIELDVEAQTPQMAVRMIAALHPRIAAAINAVGLENRKPVEVLGRCVSCQAWMLADSTRPIQGPNGLECGECRPNARYGF